MSERRQQRGWTSGLQPLIPLLATWTVALVLITVLVAQNVVPREDLLLDPAHTADLPWYTGLVSNLGILTWAVAAMSAAGAALLSRLAGRDPAATFLRGGATLTALLLFDDLLQLHIIVAKFLGIPKAGFYLMYGVLTAWWVLENRTEVLRTRWAMLVAAGVAFGVSVGIDQIVPFGSSAGLIFEDMAKFLGIAAWATYFAMTARDIAASIVTAPVPHADTAAPEVSPPVEVVS